VEDKAASISRRGSINIDSCSQLLWENKHTPVRVLRAAHMLHGREGRDVAAWSLGGRRSRTTTRRASDLRPPFARRLSPRSRAVRRPLRDDHRPTGSKSTLARSVLSRPGSPTAVEDMFTWLAESVAGRTCPRRTEQQMDDNELH
jgi:hypothetical protein